MNKHEVTKLLLNQFGENCKQLEKLWQNAMKMVNVERERLNKIHGEKLVDALFNTLGITLPPMSTKKKVKVPNEDQNQAKMAKKSAVTVTPKKKKRPTPKYDLPYNQLRDHVLQWLTENPPQDQFTSKQAVEIMRIRLGSNSFDSGHVSLALLHLTGVKHIGRLSQNGGPQINVYQLTGEQIEKKKAGK